MTYDLGIDLGTTWTAAAVIRDGRAEMVNLGNRGASVPTLLLVRDDGELLVGDAAARRGVAEPDRLAREFKRRLGDPTPLLLGGSPWSSETLMARTLRWVVDAVAALEGGPPRSVCVSHPANWGPYKKELLGQAVRLADLELVSFVTEPEAAAISYASNERVEVGEVVLVYDLGGGTFDAAVLRKTADGFEILGEPEGIEHLGGLDFDEAVFGYVAGFCDGALERGDPADDTFARDVARLRQECVDAKEALSSDTETTVAVTLPDLRTEVRLARAELEAMIRAPLSETIAALRRALRSAGVEPAGVSRVLLVGGSSRIPMVAEMVGGELRRPVAVDAHPKHAVALGAARHAAAQAAAVAPAPPPATLAVAPPDPPPVAPPPPAAAPVPAAAPPAVAAPPVAATPPVIAAPPPAVAPPTVAAPPAAAVVPPAAPPPPPASPPPPVRPAAPGPPAAAPPAAAVPPVAPPSFVPPAAPAHLPPSAPASSPGGARSRTPLLVGAGIAAVVLIAVVAVLALGGGGGGDDDGGDEQLVIGAETCPPDDRPSVCITGVRNESGQILADFRRQGDVSLEASADEPHAEFFFSDDPDTAQIWGSDSPFEWQGQVSVTSSRELCVVVIDGSGDEFPDSGNCADVPEG